MASTELLFEVGCEEIPAGFVAPALEAFERLFRERATAARLAHGEVKRYGTPRRLALWVKGVAEKGEDVVREVQGPSVQAAFGKDGKPTVAAEKFAASVGLPVEKLLKVQTPKGEKLAAKVEEKGQRATEVLPGILQSALHDLRWDKSMRWGDVDVTFPRPLHWIVALLGQEVLPVIFGDVRSGRVTFGHRFLSPGAIELASPADYERALEKAHVICDIPRRRAMLVERVREAARKAGGQLLEDEALVDQVTQLVELPCPVVGTFEARHLDLPPEVLVQEMKSHQRYFSVTDAKGALLPAFVAVSNTPVKDEKFSVRGYERVLRARLADGRFFFDEDRRTPLIDRVERLHRVVWQGKLGSYAEKVDRFRALAVYLAERTGASAHRATIERAATLAKADLVTGMVQEFPELQGVMGREYARNSGEPPEVALAIFEHYLPRGANDALPSQAPGALIGLADRLDSLCGIFAIGKKPTGAADPFGLRRACLGIIHITLGRGYRYSLHEAIAESLRLLESKTSDVKVKAGEPAWKDQVLEFFRGRLKALWAESEGHRADVVEAVLSAGFDDLVAARKRLVALSELVGQSDFGPLAATFKRVANIVQKQGQDVAGGAVDPARLVDAPERELHSALEGVRFRVTERIAADDYGAALREMVALKAVVDTFFEKVMVMCEDKALRANRIRLLLEIGNLFGRVADFAKLQAEGA